MIRLVAAVVVFVSLGGCGYRLAGHDFAPEIPHRLWIAPVDDRASEPLFGAQVARHLANRSVDRADTRLVGEGDGALGLRVRIDRVSEAGVAYTVGDQVREYVVTGEVTATLTGAGDEVVWHQGNIRADREFPSGATVEETEANKDVALELLARDLARTVLRRARLAAAVAPGE